MSRILESFNLILISQTRTGKTFAAMETGQTVTHMLTGQTFIIERLMGGIAIISTKKPESFTFCGVSTEISRYVCAVHNLI